MKAEKPLYPSVKDAFDTLWAQVQIKEEKIANIVELIQDTDKYPKMSLDPSARESIGYLKGVAAGLDMTVPELISFLGLEVPRLDPV